MGINMGGKFTCWATVLLLCGILVHGRLFSSDASKDENNISNPVVEVYEEATLLVPEKSPEGVLENEVVAAAAEENADEYLQDVADATSGKRAIDPNKIYTVRAQLPLGELLVLSTPSGCALLDDPSGLASHDQSDSVTSEALEFNFKIANLEDCATLADDIMSSLKQQIAQEWDFISKTPLGQDVKSETYESEINVRNPRYQSLDESQKSPNDFSFDDKSSEASKVDLATEFLNANLRVEMIPTSLDGIFVLHFYLSDKPTMTSTIDVEKLKEFTDAIESISRRIKDASPQELEQMQSQFKQRLEQQITDGQTLLETLSNDDVSSVLCSSLSIDECESVAAKCTLVELNGNKTCMVSPKTIFWLQETGCALQSKPGLLSIARDLCNAKVLPQEHYHSLRQSFNTNHICNALVHAYMNANVQEIKAHESKNAFEF